MVERVSRPVICIEDDPDHQKLYRDILHGLGIPLSDILMASDLKQARAHLEALRDRDPLVLLDLDLSRQEKGPGSGLGFLQEIKGSKSDYRNSPVIVVSVTSDREAVKACRRSGAIGYIQKPFDVSYFEKIVSGRLSRER